MAWLVITPKRRDKSKWLKSRPEQGLVSNNPMREDFPYSHSYERSYGTPYTGQSGEPNLSNQTGTISPTPEQNVYITRMVQ